jgi:hypothetical protein
MITTNNINNIGNNCLTFIGNLTLELKGVAVTPKINEFLNYLNRLKVNHIS